MCAFVRQGVDHLRALSCPVARAGTVDDSAPESVTRRGLLG